MLARITPTPERSFLLFGPRGSGKSAWLEATFPDGVHVDLLRGERFKELSARTEQLEAVCDAAAGRWVLIDEIQRVPELLNEVHRLIEARGQRFGMTGSSARKLRRQGVNLLAGRARTMRMHPLTALEIGPDFDVERALRFGTLPQAYLKDDRREFLHSYVATYLREEVQQEALVRDIGVFSRFLEAASMSQGSALNMAAVARECHVNARAVENYFGILDDLLIATRLHVFTHRAKRKLSAHPKFYFFDPGVYRAIRPRGPLDTEAEIDGAALETLFLSQLRAVNDGFDLGYEIKYWRTQRGAEVDFVLYGERGLFAFEIKRSDRLRSDDLDGLRAFVEDYPVAKAYVVHLGRERTLHGAIEGIPLREALLHLREILEGRDPGRAHRPGDR